MNFFEVLLLIDGGLLFVMLVTALGAKFLLPEIRNALFGICGVSLGVSVVLILISLIPPAPQCVAPAGSKVVWAEDTGGGKYVFTDMGNKRYCRISNERLFWFGIGNHLDQDYEGYPVARP